MIENYQNTIFNTLKGSLLLLLAFLCYTNIAAQCGERFVTEVFEADEIYTEQDTQYGSNVAINGDDITLKFDFYAPSEEVDPMEARPLIIWAHGGFFIQGDENNPGITSLAESYALKGYACASINYRLLDLATATPALVAGTVDELFVDEITRAVADMRAAVRYFRQDADTDNTYKIDPNQIFVGGISAGGVLSAHVGYLTDDQGLDTYETVDVGAFVEANGGYEGDSGNPGYSSEVSGVISLSGALGDTSFMQAGEVPIISVHDDGDAVVPYGADMVTFPGTDISIAPMMGSELIHEKANELGISSVLLTFDSDDHVGYFTDPADAALTDSFITVNLAPLVECTMDFITVESIMTTCDMDAIDTSYVASGALQDTQYIVTNAILASDLVYVTAESDVPTSNDTMFLTNLVGCDSLVVTEYMATAIETIPNLSIRVYPNPASEVFTVELFGEQQEKVDLRLYDLSGKMLMEFHTVSNQFINIDATDLAAGIYTLSIDTEEGTTYRKVVLH